MEALAQYSNFAEHNGEGKLASSIFILTVYCDFLTANRIVIKDVKQGRSI